MTDFKHFKVLHKPSNKIISIFQITKDATWKGKERDELIAIPADTPKDINEIKMCFTKESPRYKGTKKEQIITAFFKRKSGQPETLSEKRVGGEGEAHKLAKNEIYEKLYNKKLTINGKTIYELGTKDLRISEEEHSDTGHSIADVFIKFGEYPNQNPSYGFGIDIEIQFSPQNKGRTKERTLSRLRDGWSVIWLWADDFDNNGKLKLKDLKVLPREKQLKELREEEYNDFLEQMNEVANLIDDKIKFGKEEINEELKHSKEIIYYASKNQMDKIKKLIVEIPKEKVNEEINRLMNEEEIISKIISLFGDEVINKLKKQFNEEMGEGIKMIDIEQIKEKILKNLCENPRLLNDFGDIFTEVKMEELMKKVGDSFPLYVRDFFLSHFDDMLIKIYEDKFKDIEKRLNNIKNEKDLYEPNKRFLVNKGFQSKGYKKQIYPIKNITQQKIGGEDDKKNS